MGVVDLLVDTLGPGLDEPSVNTRRYLEQVAIEMAKKLASGQLKTDKKKSMQDKILNYALQFTFVKDLIFNKAKTQVMKLTQGLYPAPLKVINFAIFVWWSLEILHIAHEA